MHKKLPLIEVGIKFLNWEITDSLDAGGSGDVFIVKNETQDNYILKKLRQTGKGRAERFDNEIEILYLLKDNPGVINIITDYQKHSLEVKEKWYIIEKGISLTSILQNKIELFKKNEHLLLKWIFEKYIELLKTLNNLHIQKIYHRDIKPENIVYINNRFVFIDFGIAKNEKNTCINLTEQYDKYNLGAKFYMAPEMRRNPLDSDNSKADIYSITKALWATLTGEYLSFDGQYNELQNWLLKFTNKFPNFSDNLIQLNLEKETINKIATMFYQNTSELPEQRMGINETISVLEDWINIFYTNNSEINLSFSQKDNDRRWNFAINKFFKNNIPYFYQWESIKINQELFDIFDNDYFDIYLSNKSTDRLMVNIKENELILYNQEKKIIHIVDYSWLFYRQNKDYEYFYNLFKIGDELIAITKLHLKGEYAESYLNGVCRSFESKHEFLSEENYLYNLTKSISLFKEHLNKKCPYCFLKYK